MAKLPSLSIPERIDSIPVKTDLRPYLGASMIGHPCSRYVAYSFYWAYRDSIPASLNRIFRLGDAIEEQIVNALKTIGIVITGDQLNVQGDTVHSQGHIDGIAHHVPGFNEKLLFEAKSMNHTNFLEVKRKGVQEAKYTHYVQMQTYMGRLNIRFGLYVVMNKNDCSLYTELLPFDIDCYEKYRDIEEQVLEMDHINEFPRISSNPSWYQCKKCPAKSTCHQGHPVEQNCRTCLHRDVWSDGIQCVYHSCELGVAKQREGCPDYTMGSEWQ